MVALDLLAAVILCVDLSGAAPSRLGMASSACRSSVALPVRRAPSAAAYSSLRTPIAARRRVASDQSRAATMTNQAAVGTTGATAAAATAAATPEPRKEVWTVGGHSTEVLELPAASAQPECTVLVIPGNPGAAPYYTPFMRALHARLGGRAEVLAVSNLGMVRSLTLLPACGPAAVAVVRPCSTLAGCLVTASLPCLPPAMCGLQDSLGLVRPGTLHSLEDQVAHKTALLRERLAGPGRPPLVLLGHSIGTYLAIHATHRTERHYESSSRAAAAAVDAVARREWEHPAADSSAASSPQRAEQELLAARRAQQAAPGGLAGSTDAASAAAAARGSGGASSSGGGAGSSNIVKVVGLFPFLQVDPDCSQQRRLRRLTRHHGALALVAGAAGWLPLGVRRALVRWASPKLEPHAVDTTAQSESGSQKVPALRDLLPCCCLGS